MVFFSSFSAPDLAHCPMQGPQAFEKTLAPSSSNVLINPSLWMVCLTCSDPGVIVKVALIPKFLSSACLAMDADLDMSSYEIFLLRVYIRGILGYIIYRIH